MKACLVGASNLLRWVLKSRMPLRGLVISTTRCTMSKHDNVRTLKIDKRRAHPLHCTRKLLQELRLRVCC